LIQYLVYCHAGLDPVSASSLEAWNSNRNNIKTDKRVTTMTDKKPTSSDQTSQHTSSEDSASKNTTASQSSKNVPPKSHSSTDASLKTKTTKENVAKGKLSKNSVSNDQSPKNNPTRKTDLRPIGRRSLRKKISYLLFVTVLLTLICAAAYSLWQFWRVQDTRISAAQQQQSNLSVIVDKNTEQLQQQLTEQKNQLAIFTQQSNKDQQLLQQRLDAQLAKINTLSGISRDGWMLEEARHLLRLANQRQLTGSNVSGIIGLLQAADDLLREIDLPDLFAIREKINNDLVALKIAPSVDREGIYLQLNSLISQVESLPQAPVTLALKEKKKATVDAENKNIENEIQPLNQQAESKTLWQKITTSIRSAVDSLDDYVRISHHNEKIEPLLSDPQHIVSQENLRLMLEQAQTALLREEAVVYQKSIEKAAAWLHKHYGHYPEKTAMVALLNELKTQPILTQLPNVSSSLYTLSQYIDSHSQLSANVKNDESSEPSLEATK
jgi:uroporphyrin-3 C-methyltransferase